VTAPAPATVCKHCSKQPVVRRIHVRTVGSVPVNLGLCDCDLLRCANARCRAVVGHLPPATTHCPACRARL
jgi:hypothetical protein